MSEIDAEEGEIIDDDFEDISDNSIILNETGKFLSSKDPLPVISLSSVSEAEDEDLRMLKMKMKRFRRFHGHHHHHRRHKERRKINYQKKKKWKRLMNSSSDSESSFDLELDRKLQNQLKAAIRVQNNNCQKNSLKSRLRAMTKVDILENKNEVNNKPNSEENDDELIQLRLEALKTAVLNKLEHRKKRKIKEIEDNEMVKSNLDTNKENDNIQIKKPCLDMDEDEDVLRALLLASMSKKITKNVDKPQIEPKPKPNIYHKCIPPKIKPIIININADSETDDDKIINKNTTEIENSVEKFLKEQRAKVEEAQTPITATTKPDNSLILEKSAVKLLPKVKQIEYHKLLLRLKNAQKKPRVRKVSFKGDDRKIVRKVASPDKSGMPDIKQDARILHNALKEMQKEKNGRLQIEEKYVVLTPIIRKINEATTERKKYDQEVKRLLDELTQAKEKLHITHCNFSSNVTELLKKKEEIDKNIFGINIPYTSTPNKINHINSSLDNVLNVSETDVCNVGITDNIDEINPGDPNDIHRIYEKQIIPKYVSPLDYIKRDISDPFVIMCPYDIDGNCRDLECTYKHYSR